MKKDIHVVVMFDTNAHSQQAEDRYHHIRDSINEIGWEDEDETQPISKGVDVLLEMARAEFPEMNFIVEQWDTAQLYHEKNGFHYMLPELADGHKDQDIGRFALSRNFIEGHYHVLPPIYGEEEYYDAVATFLQVLPITEHEKARLAQWDEMDVIEKATTLQPLYRKYMNPLPNRYRGGEYQTAFEAYHKARFNAGEATAENFLKQYEPDKDMRTAFVFVSLDREALHRVHEARRGKDDKGTFMVFSVKPDQFLAMVRQLKRDMQKDMPQEQTTPAAEQIQRDGHGTIYPRKLMDFVERGAGRKPTGWHR